MAFLAALSKGGAVIGLVLLVVALLKQLITLVGVLLAIVKLAIIVVFVAVLVMIFWPISANVAAADKRRRL